MTLQRREDRQKNCHLVRRPTENSEGALHREKDSQQESSRCRWINNTTRHDISRWEKMR